MRSNFKALFKWLRLRWKIFFPQGLALLQSSFGELAFFWVGLLLWSGAFVAHEAFLFQPFFHTFFWGCLFFLLILSLDPWLCGEQQSGVWTLLWLSPLSQYQLFGLLVLRQSVLRVPLILSGSFVASVMRGGGFAGFLLIALLGLLGGSSLGVLLGLLKHAGSKERGHLLLLLLALPFYVPIFLLGVTGWELCANREAFLQPCLGLLGTSGLNTLFATAFGGSLLRRYL